MIPKRFSTRLRNPRARRPEPASPPDSPSENWSEFLAANPDPTAKEHVEINFSNAHDQMQCPLFSKIPPEIRNEIFYLALQEYTDPAKPYERQTFYTRPGFEGEKRVDVVLLRTCKRVYEETKVLPLRDLEAVFYLGQKPRAAKDHQAVAFEVYGQPYSPNFTLEHWSRIGRVHVFAQMYALRHGLEILCRGTRKTLNPTTLIITFRYTDWWYWEQNAAIYPIRRDQFFGMNQITLPNSVTKVVVEFEYIEAKIKQLEGVVDEMFARRDWWYWKTREGKKLVVKGINAKEEGAVREWKWQGPTKFSNREERWAHHGDGESMAYVVKEVTWEVAKDGSA